MRTTRFFHYVCFIALLLGAPAAANAANVTLAWDRNAETDVVGYRLSYGVTLGNYPTTIDVGNVMQWTITGLAPGQTYHFVVAAYTDLGVTSPQSSPVTFQVPIVTQTGRLTYDPETGAWSKSLTDGNGNTPADLSGWTVLAGDFNRDGAADFLMYNPVTGSWLKAVDARDGTYTFFGYQWAPGWTTHLADFDADGRSDVFLYNRTTGQWFRCISTGANDFAYTTGLWAPNWRVTPADFNADGRSDLFLYNDSAQSANAGLWFRVITAADGSFGYIPGDVRWAANWQVTPADFNGDRRSEIFLYRGDGQWFRVFFTATSAQYSGGLWAPGWTIRPGDFDGNGASDLFLYNEVNGSWFVARTQASGEFAFHPGLWAPAWQIAPTDFNADGRTDLLLYNRTNGQWFEATTTVPGAFSFVTGTGGTGSGLKILR